MRLSLKTSLSGLILFLWLLLSSTAIAWQKKNLFHHDITH